MKPTFTLIGQTSGLASTQMRSQQAVPIHAQEHTVLTGLGLSGAVLVLKTALSENAVDVAHILDQGLSPSQKLCVCKGWVMLGFGKQCKERLSYARLRCAKIG